MSQNETKISPPAKTLLYTALMVRNFFTRSKLKRIPEPFALTEQEQHVEEYSRAIQSVMVLPYIQVLDIVRRLLPPSHDQNIKALDLCCGPGHFTRMLAKELNCQEVNGVDLSEPMLQKAKENAKKENLTGRLNYLKMDVTSLDGIATNSMDLVSFMDGAHHMNSIDRVTEILKEANRVAKPDGVIVILDPVRPKSKPLADLYLKVAGQAYIDLGLNHFNKDFHDSVFASWSPEELFHAIPKSTGRKWVQLIPFGFPAFQILIGLPEGRKEVFVHKGFPKSYLMKWIPKEGVADWKMLRLSFRLAKMKVLLPEGSSQNSAEL